MALIGDHLSGNSYSTAFRTKARLKGLQLNLTSEPGMSELLIVESICIGHTVYWYCCATSMLMYYQYHLLAGGRDNIVGMAGVFR